MRSAKVFKALNTLQNRFLLCRITSKAVRGFHRPTARIPDTMNEVLDRIAGAEPRNLLVKPERKKRPEPRCARYDPQRGTSESKVRKLSCAAGRQAQTQRVSSLWAEVRSPLFSAEASRAKNRSVEGKWSRPL
jgi:hypothetical protein